MRNFDKNTSAVRRVEDWFAGMRAKPEEKPKYAKDEAAFESGEGVCYVDSDGNESTRRDFEDAAGEGEAARAAFDAARGASIEKTIADSWAFSTCPRCGKGIYVGNLARMADTWCGRCAPLRTDGVVRMEKDPYDDGRKFWTKREFLFRPGVTTLVGLLGTDGYTKSPELLLAKTKALNNEGITAYCLTNSYAYPPRTITGSVANDILYISEIIGCKLAIADHRCSHPTRDELIRLVSDIRMASLVSGKVGELHVHVGASPEGIEPIMDIVRTTDIPISHFRPTHLGRRLEEASQFTHMGGYADITAKAGVSEFFPGLMETAVPELLTISSDSNGSMPKWDEKHEHIVGMGVGDMANLYRVVYEMVTQQGVALEKALPFITSNVARALELYPRKGCIAEGSDADLVLLDEGYEIDTMLAKGRIMMQDQQVLVKGTFE